MLVFSSLPLAAGRTAVSLITYSCGSFPSSCVLLNLLTFSLLTLVFVHPLYSHHSHCPSCFSPCFSFVSVSSLAFSRRQPGCQMCLCSCESLPFTTWPFTGLSLLFFLNNVKQYKSNKQTLAIFLTPKSHKSLILFPFVIFCLSCFYPKLDSKMVKCYTS